MKKGESKTQVVCDYLAGMTDQYSMAEVSADLYTKSMAGKTIEQ